MADLARCVHCGLCINACPTYLVTGLETESPRGRIALARAVAEGTLPLGADVEVHWDRCLQCRACEVSCPSSVPYGRIMESLRAQISAAPQRDGPRRWLRRLLLRNLVARPPLLALATAPLRAYAGSRLRRRLLDSRLPGRLGRLERQLVAGQGAAVRPGATLVRPEGEPRGRAILFTGCVMGELFGEVHRATARLLARRGIDLEAVPGQGCCGALAAHDGDLDHARDLARRNVEALAGDDRPIIVNAAGCGAALREYPELLAGDPVWSERASALAARVRDLSEYLLALAPSPPARFPARVSYQDPCHLAHVQGVTSAPRDLLRGVEGCELVESPDDSVCCGAAGLYSVLQPRLSDLLKTRKVELFRRSRPDIIVTANPGCQMQYAAAVREGDLGARVLHLAEFLDRAERNAEAAGR